MTVLMNSPDIGFVRFRVKINVRYGLEKGLADKETWSREICTTQRRKGESSPVAEEA